MNFSPTPETSAPTSPRAGSTLAKIYTKDGRTLRVPLRPVSAGDTTCHQHPERQFIRWFNRYSAASPGFPAMVKSILLIVPGPTDCRECNQIVRRFLQRFYLAGKLRIRAASPTPADCSRRNGFGSKTASATGQPVQTELDRILNTGS